jgi:hypothetical protein
VHRLAPPPHHHHIRQAILGEAHLPCDIAPPSPIPARNETLSSPQPRSPLSDDFIVAVVETGPHPRAASVRIASALSRHAGVKVFICPWYQIFIDHSRVRLRGPMRQAVGGVTDPVQSPLRSAVQPDALFFYATATSGTFQPTMRERSAMARLGRLGVNVRNPDKRQIIHRLLLEAARHGVITNAVGPQARWAMKDQLELILRSYCRETGDCLPRPRTYLATAKQFPVVLRSFAKRGIDSIAKPAAGTRGIGIAVARPDSLVRPDGNTEYWVVQELLNDPLTLDGHKVDLRCYVVIDVDSPAASGRLPLVLLRRSGVPYRRAIDDAEIANYTYQQRQGLPAQIMPLDRSLALARSTYLVILQELDGLVERLVRAHFWWAAQRSAPAVGNRVLLWGVDVLVGWTHQKISLHLLEVNVHCQLLRGSPESDAAVEEMLREHFLPALIRSRCRGLAVNSRWVNGVSSR